VKTSCKCYHIKQCDSVIKTISEANPRFSSKKLFDLKKKVIEKLNKAIQINKDGKRLLEMCQVKAKQIKNYR
jgi:hypothetical protein